MSAFSEGESVFGVLMREYVGDGTFAEYVVVPEAIGLAKLPQGLDPASAGAPGLAGATAHSSVSAVAPREGETVLIAGANGGVGAEAVQLAVRAGATAGLETEFVTGLGAHRTVDHTADVPSQVRVLAADGVDAVIHLAGDGLQLADLVRPGGRFASALGLGRDQLSDRGLDATAVMGMPTRDVLDALAESAVTGDLKVPIDRTYRLDEVPQALKDFSQGKLGKLAVAVL